jgi:hypothetical protein
MCSGWCYRGRAVPVDGAGPLTIAPYGTAVAKDDLLRAADRDGGAPQASVAQAT